MPKAQRCRCRSESEIRRLDQQPLVRQVDEPAAQVAGQGVDGDTPDEYGQDAGEEREPQSEVGPPVFDDARTAKVGDPAAVELVEVEVAPVLVELDLEGRDAAAHGF